MVGWDGGWALAGEIAPGAMCLAAAAAAAAGVWEERGEEGGGGLYTAWLRRRWD